MVWFGVANFGFFLRIYPPNKLRLTYRFVCWNSVAKLILWHIINPNLKTIFCHKSPSWFFQWKKDLGQCASAVASEIWENLWGSTGWHFSLSLFIIWCYTLGFNGAIYRARCKQIQCCGFFNQIWSTVSKLLPSIWDTLFYQNSFHFSIVINQLISSVYFILPHI
jgi:hypothetical protein